MSRVAITLFLVVLACQGCGSGPHLEIPTPTEEEYVDLRLRGIHSVSPYEVFVVGSLTRPDGTPEGLILHTETQGRMWRRYGVESNELGRVAFQTVFFADRLRGWVAGIRVDGEARTRATVFLTRDGGNHWREVMLPQDPDLLVTDVHTLKFASDEEGAVSVSFTHPDSGAEQQSAFITGDGGRSWTAATWRAENPVPAPEQSLSMLNEEQGFRLTQSAYAGSTYIEFTGSAGRDWMPVSEVALSALSTYYQ